MRAMDDADLVRHMELRRIFHIDRHGTVDGVEIDLRHELLDPREWGTSLIGDSFSKRRSPREPFVWFPWFGKFDKELIRKEIIEDEIKHGREQPSEEFLDSWVRDHTPECFVYRGDKIVIDNIERIQIGDYFDHPHDSEIRYARLRIIRAKGRSQKITKPLMFVGNTSLFAPRAGRDFFYKIAHRICRHFKIKSLGEMDKIKEEHSYAYGALSRAQFLQYLTKDIRKLADDFLSRSVEHNTAFSTCTLIDSAVVVGYLWAKAESELGLKPLAEASLRSKAGGSLGGNKSGEARRNKRAKTWEPHARELANAIRKEQPSFSQDRVAGEIVARWKEASFDPPGHKTLKSLLSQMERNGHLPARKTT
jgi:hypothetical protein